MNLPCCAVAPVGVAYSMAAMTISAVPAAMPPTLARRQNALAEFVEVVRRHAGDDLRAMVACGPAVAGHAEAPVDTAIVLAGNELPFLRALARQGRRFDGAGLGAPLVLTADGIAASRDTFPLELLDLQQCHWPLAGEAAFAGLVFDAGHVRLQCERELKALKIQLRRRLLGAAGKEASLALADLGDEVIRIARGLLLLRGQTAPREASEVLAAASATLARPLPASLAAWRGATGWDAFAAFYAEVDGLWGAVDAA